jgi:glycopeptide antibiotics resistance protein
LQDAFNNVLLFVPFGLLLGLLINGGKAAAGRWHLALGAILLMAAVSAGFETLQIFVPRRAPSVDDLIFNILGGGVSLFSVLAWGLRWTKKTPVDWRRPSAPRPIVIFWSQT